MTIRLSAMFEEHIRRIIYNWKSARRRETNQKKKSRTRTLRVRNNGQKTAARQDSDESSDELSPVRRAGTTSRKIIPNGHPGTSKSSNGPVARPVIRMKTTKNSGNASSVTSPSNHGKRKVVADSDSSENEKAENSDSDSDIPLGCLRGAKRKPSESEESYRPGNRGTKKVVRNTRNKGRKTRNYCTDDDEEDGGGNGDEYNSEEDNSDNVSFNRNGVRELRTPKTVVSPSKRTTILSDYDSDDEPLINTVSSAASASKSIGQRGGVESGCSSSARSRNSPNMNYTRNITTSSQDESTHDSAAPANNRAKLSARLFTLNASDDEEDELPQRSVRAKRLNYRSMLQISGSDDDEYNPSQAERSTRRTVKRPRYNESSDEDFDAPGSNTRPRRSAPRVSINDDSDSNAEPPPISISSRGRVRKLTARARALLRD